MGSLQDGSWKKAMAQWQSGISTYRRLLFTAVSLFGLAAMAWAGWNEGVAAYNQGDYATAYREFLPLAQQGNSQAQVRLGAMYAQGYGVPQDYTEAVQWFRKAAGQKEPFAQTILGIMYSEGQGVLKDYTEAVQWFRKAADQGDAAAQFFLGSMYYNGHGIPQDYAEAVKWVRKAADQGEARGQYALGYMYTQGHGVPQDYVQAHLWLNLAASRLPPGNDQETAAKDRDMIAEKMTPAQIAEAQRLARQWKSKQP